MNKNTLKSIGAVLAGFMTVAILSIVTDLILEGLGIFPPPEKGLFITWMLLLALIYRSAYTIVGGYITAMLAPNKPMLHVRILGIIGTVAAILGVVGTWGKGLGPEWYPISLVIFGYPCIWLGGKMRMSQAKK